MGHQPWLGHGPADPAVTNDARRSSDGPLRDTADHDTPPDETYHPGALSPKSMRSGPPLPRRRPPGDATTWVLVLAQVGVNSGDVDDLPRCEEQRAL